MMIYAVWADTCGAHESGDLMSLWSTLELAETEVARLNTARAVNPLSVFTMYGGPFSVKAIELDKPSNGVLL